MRIGSWAVLFVWAVSAAVHTGEAGFSNSLGMQLLPVPGSPVLLGKYEVQVRDYEIFARATQRPWPKAPFKQGGNHPAVNVSWEDAKAFAYWLTAKEQKEGTLPKTSHYRLPTDAEWSLAAGVQEDSSAGGAFQFPWGSDWPPPPQAGNYSPELSVDAFPNTSPAGSFPPNAAGFCDLGGNAWEWCEDTFNQSVDYRILRGGSWRMRLPGDLLSTARIGNRPDIRLPVYGFRLALERAKPWEPAEEPGAQSSKLEGKTP